VILAVELDILANSLTIILSIYKLASYWLQIK